MSLFIIFILLLTYWPIKTNCSKEGFEKLDHHNPLKSLGPQAISHLKSEHINYVMQWTAFLQLENSIENTRDNLSAKSSDLWTLSYFERLVIIHYIYYYFMLQILSSFIFF